MASNNSDTISIILSLQTAQALQKLGAFVAFAAGSLGQLHTYIHAAELAEQFALLSEKIGESIQTVAGLTYAFEKDNVSAESLQKGIKSLSAEMVKHGEADKTVYEKLLQLSDQFKSLPDGAQKAALAVQYFGKAGLDLIPTLNQGSVALAAMIDRGERLRGLNESLALSAKEALDTWKDFKIVIESLATSISENVMPTVTSFLKSTVENILKLRDAVEAFNRFMSGRGGLEGIMAGKSGVKPNIDFRKAAEEALAAQPKITNEYLESRGKELEIAKQLIKLGIEASAMREKQMTFLERDNAYSAQGVQLVRERKLLEEQQSNLELAHDEKIISELDYQQAKLKLQKEQFSLEQQSQALEEKRRNDRISHVANNWRTTDADKFTQIRALSNPAEVEKMGPDPSSFSQQWTAAITALSNQFGTLAQQVATAFKGIVNTSISAVTDGITGLIMKTKTWGEALRDIGRSIITNIVSSIVKMGTEWIAQHIVMKAVTYALHLAQIAWGWIRVTVFGIQEGAKAATGEGIAAASAAAMIPIATALAAVWATPATLATIASYGTAAETAPALIAVAEAVTLAQAAIPRESGGPVTAGRPYIVGERRPELFVPSSSGYIMSSVPSPSASMQQSRSSQSVSVENHVHNWPDEEAMLKFVKDNPKAHHVFVQKIRDNSLGRRT